jgi:hypothetical protein
MTKQLRIDLERGLIRLALTPAQAGPICSALERGAMAVEAMGGQDMAAEVRRVHRQLQEAIAAIILARAD